MKTLSFDIKKYNFREVVSSILQVEYLETIHKSHYDNGFLKENYVKDHGKSLQKTLFHKKF